MGNLGPVLIVEREETTRLFLAKVLEKDGYQAVALGSEFEALSWLREGQAPSLILLDAKEETHPSVRNFLQSLGHEFPELFISLPVVLSRGLKRIHPI